MALHIIETIFRIIITSMIACIVWLLNPIIFETFLLWYSLVIIVAVFLIPVIIYELISWMRL